MILHKTDKKAASLCIDFLKCGKIVILPTDTVYGFSGIVESGEKIFRTEEKIRAIKGRDEGKPFIRLIAHPDEIRRYAKDAVPDSLLAKWPGALTIIVNDGTGGTVAYRCPGDAWLRAVIAQSGPVYSTSVNKSGKPVLEKIGDIIETFEDDVDLIISSGDTSGALPSTIVDISSGTLRVLRQGAVQV